MGPIFLEALPQIRAGHTDVQNPCGATVGGWTSATQCRNICKMEQRGCREHVLPNFGTSKSGTSETRRAEPGPTLKRGNGHVTGLLRRCCRQCKASCSCGRGSRTCCSVGRGSRARCNRGRANRQPLLLHRELACTGKGSLWCCSGCPRPALAPRLLRNVGLAPQTTLRTLGMFLPKTDRRISKVGENPVSQGSGTNQRVDRADRVKRQGPSPSPVSASGRQGQAATLKSVMPAATELSNYGRRRNVEDPVEK